MYVYVFCNTYIHACMYMRFCNAKIAPVKSPRCICAYMYCNACIHRCKRCICAYMYCICAYMYCNACIHRCKCNKRNLGPCSKYGSFYIFPIPAVFIYLPNTAVIYIPIMAIFIYLLNMAVTYSKYGSYIFQIRQLSMDLYVHLKLKYLYSICDNIFR